MEEHTESMEQREISRYDTEAQQSVFHGICKLLLLYLGTQLVLGLIGGIFLIGFSDLQGGLSVEGSLELLISLFSGGLVIYLGKKRFSIPKEAFFTANPWSFSTILCYAFVAIGCSLCGSILVFLINALGQGWNLTFTQPDFSFQQDVVYNITFLISVLGVAPILEEAIFRGVITHTLQRYDKRFAIIISALLFAMMHLNLVQGIPTFLMGLVLGYVYITSQSLYPCILIHFINNLMAVLEGVLQTRFAWFSIAPLIYGLAIILFAIMMLYQHKDKLHLPSCAKTYHLYRNFFNSFAFVALSAITLAFVFGAYLMM